ncbi:MAG: hypothetical protein LC659_12120 [Myxococcales bacterium]|nr:hypothetical protein [Myxococcales bacterium]
MSEKSSDIGVATDLQRRRTRAVDALSAVDQQVRAILAEHPIAALACVVGIGFVVGRLLTSRGSGLRRRA